MPRKVSRIALAAAAVIAMSAPLTGTASAMSYDRHEVARASVIVRATSGHLVLARRDVTRVGGRVTRSMPEINGFVAQVPVTALDRLRSAPEIASVTVQGTLIRQ